MDQKDDLIWKKIQQKDIKAFESYYKEHYKSFYLMACKYLKDPVLAEEIVNDVFLKLWEDGPDISIQVSLKSYLYKAVINRSINLLYKTRKETQRITDLNNIPDEGYEMRQMEENELKVNLYQAISKLPEKCRKVFEMSRFEGLKQQEIADKLGVSVKTVKNQITHALKEINKSIENYLILIIFIIKNILHF